MNFINNSDLTNFILILKVDYQSFMFFYLIQTTLNLSKNLSFLIFLIRY